MEDDRERGPVERTDSVVGKVHARTSTRGRISSVRSNGRDGRARLTARGDWTDLEELEQALRSKTSFA